MILKAQIIAEWCSESAYIPIYISDIAYAKQAYQHDGAVPVHTRRLVCATC